MTNLTLPKDDISDDKGNPNPQDQKTKQSSWLAEISEELALSEDIVDKRLFDIVNEHFGNIDAKLNQDTEEHLPS